MSDKIVFSYWDTVIYSDKEVPVADFLRNIEHDFEVNHKADSFAVFFDEENKKFFMNVNGKKYEVVFQDDVQEKLNKCEYNSLLIKLISLANETKRLLDEEAIKKTREEVINRIDNSFYEEMETPENYQIYLDYLEEKLSNTDNEEEKRVIDTKMANIIKILGDMRKSNSRVMINPLERKYNVVSYLYELLEKSESLDQKDRIEIAKEVKKIVIDYKKLQNDKVKGKVKDNFVLPLDILNRISDLEQKISLLSSEPERKNSK